ncbi:MAG: histidine phosphatase family protein [Lachnospiraceae bacterium]|nr:histidine phosphatase family protein [Lachnospiraceae bacterium]
MIYKTKIAEIGDGDDWFEKKHSGDIVSEYFAEAKRKTIITVQHTQSVHHINGHIGAWGDFELTPSGHEHAYAIGRWLEHIGFGSGDTMYVSDLKRAAQTAEEINKTLGIKPIVTDVLREINAGAGNGQTVEWYREHKAPQGVIYDPDYLPFPDAESDRDLWVRLFSFARELFESDAERIVVVSHGTALSILHMLLLGLELEDRAHFRFHGSAGSVSCFHTEPDGRISVEYINRPIG